MMISELCTSLSAMAVATVVLSKTFPHSENGRFVVMSVDFF